MHAAWARFLPWPFVTFCALPLSVIFVRSALPSTSIRTLTDWIVPVGVATCCPAAASVSAVKTYVAVPFAFVVGVDVVAAEREEARRRDDDEPRRAALALARAGERERARRERLALGAREVRAGGRIHGRRAVLLEMEGALGVGRLGTARITRVVDAGAQSRGGNRREHEHGECGNGRNENLLHLRCPPVQSSTAVWRPGGRCAGPLNLRAQM